MAEADWRRMEERTLLARVVAMGMGMGMEEAMEALVAEVVLMVEVVVTAEHAGRTGSRCTGGPAP